MDIFIVILNFNLCVVCLFFLFGLLFFVFLLYCCNYIDIVGNLRISMVVSMVFLLFKIRLKYIGYYLLIDK